MNNTVFYNQFAYQQSLKPSRGIIDLSCETYSFTVVSTKWLSVFSQLTIHSNFSIAHTSQQFFHSS
jgi:hypothetical protein